MLLLDTTMELAHAINIVKIFVKEVTIGKWGYLALRGQVPCGWVRLGWFDVLEYLLHPPLHTWEGEGLVYLGRRGDGSSGVAALVVGKEEGAGWRRNTEISPPLCNTLTSTSPLFLADKGAGVVLKKIWGWGVPWLAKKTTGRQVRGATGKEVTRTHHVKKRTRESIWEREDVDAMIKSLLDHSLAGPIVVYLTPGCVVGWLGYAVHIRGRVCTCGGVFQKVTFKERRQHGRCRWG